MTDQNNAVQAATQPTVLTREQVGELYKDWVCIFGMSPGSAELCIREIEAAVLSKLRAPVADEQERGYAENAAFRVWRDERQACPEHSLITENAAHAAWQERGRRAALASAPVAGDAVAWENFPAYLIDHCEGDTITEEGLQHALSRMLADPKYAAPQASEAECSCPSGNGSLRHPRAVHPAQRADGGAVDG